MLQHLGVDKPSFIPAEDGATVATDGARRGIVADLHEEAHPDYSLGSAGLRFVDPEVEKRFHGAHVAEALPTIRAFLICAALFYGIFGVLDDFVIPREAATAWLIRYGLVCPCLIGVTLLTYTRFFLRASQIVMSVGMFLAGTGILLMTAVASEPGNALYYAGLIGVVSYGASLVRLRCLYAAVGAVLLVALYQLVATVVNPIPPLILLSNDFFLVMAVAIGIFSSYVQEVQARRDFVSDEELRAETIRSERLMLAAEAASRAKSDFLAVMSHELRTPLNAILGFSEIMQHQMFGPLGSARYGEYTADIHTTAQHLLRIINDILDLSKAEVGKLTLAESDVDLWTVLDESLRLLRERAGEGGVRLSLRMPEAEPPLVRADAQLLKQSFINLLSNAIKFTPSGGAVEAAIALEADGACVVRFADTGIGIAESDLPRVLEPFVQIESAFARKHGGTGLGLPLAKKIAELHGGSLEITSRLGAGTSVAVRLPPWRVVERLRTAGAA
jgi:two-component system, cell cycle sensor histidine kinase PleC